MTELEKRMDRFDAVVCEYLRSTKGSVENLSERIGCSPSSLWRYRTRSEAFERMPLIIFANIMRLSNASNLDLRYICGLPTGLNNNEK